MSQTVPPILSVVPTRALVDEKIKVVVENLPPGSPVTLHSLHHSEDKDYWEAYGHYISDRRGTVTVADDLSFGGTYTGQEAMGLLWSMRPVAGSRKGLRLRKMNVCTPMLINISVYSGHVAEGFMELTPLALAVIERWYIAPGVQRISIKEEGVQGTLFIPPGPGPFPGLLDMWGGGGGLEEYHSSLLASHGYASLALEYLSPGQEKPTDVEFTYFEKAFNFLKNHPQVIPDKVGIFGLSLGSIVTMYLVKESTIVKPACCVFVSGSHYYPQKKTLNGLQLQVAMYSHKIHVDENNHEIWKDMGLEALTDPKNKMDIAQMMNAAGKQHLLTRVEYPDAGHLIEPPFSPHFMAKNYVDVRNQKATLLCGGQTKPHADAKEDSWRKILAFLHHHLYSSLTPRAKM